MEEYGILAALGDLAVQAQYLPRQELTHAGGSCCPESLQLPRITVLGDWSAGLRWVGRVQFSMTSTF